MENAQKIQIVSCSGASNTGKYADDVARLLSATGQANMICLAKVAIGDKLLIKGVLENKSKIFVLDGCTFSCAEKIFSTAGIDDIVHINTTDYGIIKGKTPVTDEKIREIAEQIKKMA